MNLFPLSYDVLLELRYKMEKTWSAETAFPGTELAQGDPVSKGQCGIACLYLAWELEKQHYAFRFCKGDVLFKDGTPPIENHRWLKVEDKLIDLTIDQTGFPESIIYDTPDNLQARGVFHETIWERTLDLIDDKAGLFVRTEMMAVRLHL